MPGCVLDNPLPQSDSYQFITRRRLRPFKQSSRWALPRQPVKSDPEKIPGHQPLPLVRRVVFQILRYPNASHQNATRSVLVTAPVTRTTIWLRCVSEKPRPDN